MLVGVGVLVGDWVLVGVALGVGVLVGVRVGAVAVAGVVGVAVGAVIGVAHPASSAPRMIAAIRFLMLPHLSLAERVERYLVGDRSHVRLQGVREDWLPWTTPS